MMTSAIGRKFLNAYNKEYGTNYDAKTFFEKVYFPIIYGGKKYAQWVQNSPFVQRLSNVRKLIDKYKNKDLSDYEKSLKNELLKLEDEGYTYCKVARDKGKINYLPLNEVTLSKMLTEFEDKVKQGYTDASVALGYPASSEDGFQATSCQVSSLKLPISMDSVLLSWIGNSLAIGINGGQILMNDPRILIDIFKGWKYYRMMLDNDKQLNGNQINVWNAQWLVHYYDKRNFNEKHPIGGFAPFSVAKKKGGLNITMLSWTKVMISIAKRYGDAQIIGYAYILDKTNTTIGFIPFNLIQIKKPLQFYKKYFGLDSEIKAENLWGTAIGFMSACKLGVIGLKAMEPKGLAEYMRKDKYGNVKIPKPEKNEEERISYNTYKIWILSMLNNEELWQESEELAQLLSDASVNKEKKISTKSANTVNEVLSAVNKKQFVEAVTKVVSSVGATDRLVSIVKDVHSMPTDNVPYFLALVRFQYAALNNKSNH